MLNAVLDHLDLVERAYFGLQYSDQDDQMVCTVHALFVVRLQSSLYCGAEMAGCQQEA